MNAEKPLTHYQKYRQTILNCNARWQKENRDKLREKNKMKAEKKKVEKEKELLVSLTKKYILHV
jgi:hypothetical protein